MANKTIDMSKIKQILRLFKQGKSRVFFSQQTGVSRNTVKRYIRRFLQEKIASRKVYAVLSNCTYFSLDALNAAIRTAMEELNNAPFKGRNYSRWQKPMVPQSGNWPESKSRIF